jgi:uncharacterized protein
MGQHQLVEEDPGHIIVLTRAECLDLLAQVDVGRVGVSMDALPVIVPVHFSVVDDSVVFRSTLGTRLDAATLGAVVAFQADGYDPPRTSGWSVMLQGVAAAAPDGVRDPPVGPGSAHPWLSGDGDHRLIQLATDNLRGWRFATGGRGPGTP